MAMKKIIYLTREDYQTLYDGGSVIKDGVTYTYDYDAVYMVPKAAESGFVTLDTEQTITAPKHFTHAVETPLTIEFNNSTAYALRIEDTDTNSVWFIDADENAGEGYDIHLPAGSGTLALVSDIPSPSNFIQKAGDTGIGDLSFASGKKITFNGYNNTQLLLGCNSDSNGSFIRYAGPSALTISTTAADLTLSPQYNINLVTSGVSKAYYNNQEIATINQINNGQLTIQKNGSNIGTFTANQSGNSTINIDGIPDDSTLVHKNGTTETISGYKTFTNHLTTVNINPKDTNAWSLGNPDYRWNMISVNYIKDRNNRDIYTADLVQNNDILFPMYGPNYIYYATEDDAFWQFGKRYYVEASIHSIVYNGNTYPRVKSGKTIEDDDYFEDSPTELSYNSIDDPSYFNTLFNGSPDGTAFTTTADKYVKIRITPITTKNTSYSPAQSTISFPGYPYGWLIASCYYGSEIGSIKYATYNKHSSWPTGWFTANMTPRGDSSGMTYIYRDGANYTRTVMDFWFIGNGNASGTLRPTELFWIKDRVTNLDTEKSILNKYTSITLVNDLKFQQFGQDKLKLTATGNIESSGIITAGSFVESGVSLSSKYLGKTATAANSSKLNGQDASYYLNYNNLTNKPTIPSTDNFVQKSGDTMTGPLKLQDTNAQNISITAEYFNLGDETAPDWKHGIGISASNNLSQQVKFWTEYYASGNTLCADAGIYVTHNLTTEGMVRAVNGGWFDSDVRCDGKIALNNSNQKAISFDSYHKIAYETNGQLEFYALNGFLFATRNNSGTITDWNKLIPHGKHNNDLPQVAGTIAIEPHGWVTTAVYSKVITTGLKGESTTTVYTKGSKHKYVVDIIITDSETIQSVRKSMSLFGAVYKWEFTPLQLNNYIEDSLFTTINNCSRYNVLIDDAFLPNSNLGRFNGNGIKYDTFLDKGTTNVISIRLSYIEADEHNTGSLVTNGRHIQAEFYD